MEFFKDCDDDEFSAWRRSSHVVSQSPSSQISFSRAFLQFDFSFAAGLTEENRSYAQLRKRLSTKKVFSSLTKISYAFFKLNIIARHAQLHSYEAITYPTTACQRLMPSGQMRFSTPT